MSYRRPLLFPSFIIAIPKVLGESAPEITVRSVSSQPEYQVLIMQYDVTIPFDGQMHTNSCSQWGVVLDGKIKLYLGENAREKTLRRGETFYIPSGTKHGVEVYDGYKDLTIYDRPRYRGS